MENKNRLIISLVLIFATWFFLGSSSLMISAIPMLGAGVWSLIEVIIFIKSKENRDALPLALFAIYIVLFALFIGIGGIFNSIFDLVEGGIFQPIGFLLVLIFTILFPVTGAWAIIKGVILIKKKQNVKLGIVSLIIGLISTIPALFFLFTSLYNMISGPDVPLPVR